MQYLREMSLAIEDPARGQRIAALREAHNLTQAALATKIGVSTGTLSRWERGDKMLPANCDKLAKQLNVTPNFIIGGKEDESVGTFEAFEAYQDWLNDHPDEFDAMPPGAFENIKRFQLAISPERAPTLQDYLALHALMVAIMRKKRSR